MINLIDLTRNVDESPRQYIWRVGQAKDSGECDLTWEQLAPTLGSALDCVGTNESTFRKRYSEGVAWWDEVFQHRLPDEYIKQLRIDKQELQKEKVRLQDQRREYNKLLTYDARAEHLHDVLKDTAAKLEPIVLTEYKFNSNESEAIVFINDVHYGMKTDNTFNSYNTDICKERFAKYASKVNHFLEVHCPQKLHIEILGDCIAGAIHIGTRLAASENTIDQLMHVSELIAQFIAAVSENVPEVEVTVIGGNHARAVAGVPKDDCPAGDNMEKIIPFWLKERFANCKNVSIVEPEFDGFITKNILGWNILCTHGDLEKFNTYGLTMQAVFAKKYGFDIDYAIMGDKHHVESKDIAGIEQIICPAMCGVDDYADTRRLYSTAGQLVLLITPDGGAEHRSIVRFD